MRSAFHDTAARAKALAAAHGAPELSEYQIVGIDYLRSVESGILGDDPGLGKTVQAIMAAELSAAGVVVICCPTAIANQWRDECRRWVGRDATIIASPRAALPDRGWIICPYSRVKALGNLMEVDVLILDECHYIKEPKSLRTKMLWGSGVNAGLRGISRKVWLLSGTPIPNRLREVAHIFGALRPNEFPSYGSFMRRYCWSGTRFYGGRRAETYDGANNVEELRGKMRNSELMLRRRKDEVLGELPSKRTAIVPLVITENELLTIERDLVKMLSHADQAAVMDALTTGKPLPAMEDFARARRYLGRAKALAAAEWLAEEAVDDRLAVFVWHRDAGNALVEELAKLGVKAEFTCGEHFDVERVASIKRFQQNPEQRVWIGSIGACGTGLDGLQHCTTRCVFVEASYVPSQNVQAEDRLHRRGQAGAVLVQYLYAPVPLDMHLMKTVAGKARNIASVLD